MIKCTLRKHWISFRWPSKDVLDVAFIVALSLVCAALIFRMFAVGMSRSDPDPMTPDEWKHTYDKPAWCREHCPFEMLGACLELDPSCPATTASDCRECSRRSSFGLGRDVHWIGNGLYRK